MIADESRVRLESRLILRVQVDDIVRDFDDIGWRRPHGGKTFLQIFKRDFNLLGECCCSARGLRRDADLAGYGDQRARG